MPDNTTTPIADGTAIATDEIGGAHYQRIKVGFGADGQYGDVATGNRLPVDIGSGPFAVTGSFYQATQPVSLAGTVAVSGPLTDTQLRATPVPVSGTFWQATQPISGTVGVSGSVAVTGTFWQATQPVSGTFWQATQPISAAALPLPTGAATETTLSTVSGKLPTLGAKASSGSVSITPASDAEFLVPGQADVFDVTLSLDTAAYASGDVLAATQSLINAVRVNGGRAVLQSVVVVDEDDQGQGLDLVFFGANQSLGTENAAVSISDAGARDVLGIISIASADFMDLGGVRIANLNGLGLLLEAASGSRDLFVGAISRGTGTYTASGVRLRLGLVLT